MSVSFMDRYLAEQEEKNEQKLIEDGAIEAELAEQGYARTWEVPPSLAKWSLTIVLAAYVGYFLGSGALLALLITAIVVWWRAA